MQNAEKELAQLERLKKHVTYVVRMFPISDEGKFFFDRNKKYPIDTKKDNQFNGQVVAEFSFYYPEEFINEASLMEYFVQKMTLAAGKWNYALSTSSQVGFLITNLGGEAYPELKRGVDYDFEIIDKISHVHKDYSEYDTIKPLKRVESI